MLNEDLELSKTGCRLYLRNPIRRPGAAWDWGLRAFRNPAPVTRQIGAMTHSTPPHSVREFCQRLLLRGDLATKLAPPRSLEDRTPGPALMLDAPARDPGLELRDPSEPLPRPGALADPAARAACLARFAHHELMAVELFGWALLRWPEVDPELRRCWLEILAEEQTHCGLYLERLHAHGSRLSEHRLSDYFWKQLPAIAASPAGPRAFLAAMGLTLEQANLDFTLVYRDAFRAAGDEESARVCERVHSDEIGHVRAAATWIGRLAQTPREGQEAGESQDDLDAYLEAVPHPLSAARAKGRRFDVSSRRSAGLSDRFIEHVRVARSTQERGLVARAETPSAASSRTGSDSRSHSDSRSGADRK